MKLLVFCIFIISSLAMAKKKEEPIITTAQYHAHIQQVASSRIKEVVACKKKTKAKGGRVVFTWEMDEMGKPRNFSRGEDTIDNQDFYHCVIKKIEGWKFKVPPHERPIDVQHLYVL